MCADLLDTPAAGGADRVPPHDTDAERSVLGALLLDERAVAVAVDLLKEDAFYTPAHRLVFGTVCMLYERGEPSDAVTVTSLLQTRDELQRAGGAAYVSGLASNVPTTANIEYYVKIVSDKWYLRSLLQASHAIAADCFRGDAPCEEVIEKAEQRIFQIAESRPREGFQPISKMMVGVIEVLEHLQNKQGGLSGIASGFTKLDELTTGLHGGELIVVGARPSVGKTAFALNIAEHVALVENRSVAIFSLEMSAQQVLMRMLSAHARVSGQRLRRGDMSPRDWTALVQAGTVLTKAQIYIDATSRLTPLEVNARCRRLKHDDANLALVIIDYIQLLDSGGRNTESRQQEISYVSRSMKALARELDVPVMALCQLNRESERGKEVPMRPQLSQLRESGAIEQDADVVLLLYRPGMHNDDPALEDVAEAILAKQRNGPTDKVILQYLKDFARFDNPPPGFFDKLKKD